MTADATTGSAAAAGTFRLGDRTVNRMGYGAMRLSGPNIMGPPRDHDEAVAVLRTAVELGVNHIDTSDYYGPYTVNALIREALHPYPDDLVLVTKVGARRTPDGGWPPAMSRQELTGAIHENIDHLGVQAMDVVNLRMSGPGGALFTEGSLAEPFTVLLDLQQQGLVRHIGVSNVGPGPLAEARSLGPVVCVQNAYNVVDRGDDPLVDRCTADGLAFVPFFPLGGFAPLQADRFSALAGEAGLTTMQLALAWLLARSPAILTIPGTSSVAHLRENVAAAGVRLSEGDLAQLDALATA
ncbi:oxidoreductase [Nakamurella endophytica]|uniref:Oxidoreductase n=1 Tax=Nakamurella endophytica TaxID=1748367 RepID=A0A917WBY9_9ACTN|nr:oxidoreductase [Nakamurella endophytica]GGL88431.1 oxidoreductase [Nakamurella endophytica]